MIINHEGKFYQKGRIGIALHSQIHRLGKKIFLQNQHFVTTFSINICGNWYHSSIPQLRYHHTPPPRNFRSALQQLGLNLLLLHSYYTAVVVLVLHCSISWLVNDGSNVLTTLSRHNSSFRSTATISVLSTMSSFSKYCLILLGWTLTAFAAETCPAMSHVLAQRLDKFPVSNGCSKPPGVSVGGEEDFTYCCDRHDACYSTCGIAKSFCEEDFGKCMEELCNTVFVNNPQCSSAAQVYQLGTTMFGGNGFQELQNEFCECVPKSNVQIQYTMLLDKLYRMHSRKSPTEISAFVSKLVIKAGDSIPKLGRLFYKVVKKYDTSIQHEGKRVGANPPRPEKKSRSAPKQEL